ncbi:antitoxin MazE-like protein [Paraburkholderia sp. BCC1886]|uniref:antitoxin MazE-like protein n=1 Tax=Paraburkholderia sp. BCC1886 TaxID=2562670 RepID=UPI001C920789|nr:antitoxin MazE-like protein [Paraburkholderia sp. BCC1886]
MASTLAKRPQIDGRDMTDDELTAAGYKKVVAYVLDPDAPGFAEEARRQSELACQLHRKDPEEMEFLEELYKHHWGDEEE